MLTAELEIHNPSGLHARPAALFVKTAAGFRSKILVENLTRGTAPANAKSILTLLAGGVSKGHVVRISAEGEDEEQAIAALRDLVESGIGEQLDQGA